MKFASLATAWLLVAIAVGASGALQRVRPPAPQIIIAGLTLALLAAWRKSARFGAWLDAIDLRALIALHLTRFVGLSFLLLCRRGELPCSFAVPAGSGDITVATFAAVLLLAWTHVDRHRRWIGAWNALGLLDILFVVASAARHGMAARSSMAPLLRLPLCLLPTFLVPLIIASHVVIFSRLGSQIARVRTPNG